MPESASTRSTAGTTHLGRRLKALFSPARGSACRQFSGNGVRPLPPLLPIAPRQFHVDAQVAVEVRLRSVEIEVADGDSAQVPADARINRLAHDAVHAGERADVDDSGGALLRQVHRLSDVQHHLAKGALAWRSEER